MKKTQYLLQIGKNKAGSKKHEKQRKNGKKE